MTVLAVTDESVWEERARRLLAAHGYTEARRQCIDARNNNSLGTASYAFHQATLRALERLHREVWRGD